MSEGDTYPLDHSAEMWRKRALQAEEDLKDECGRHGEILFIVEAENARLKSERPYMVDRPYEDLTRLEALRARIAELEDEVARLTHVYILGNADLRAENARLREALEKAADSLRWIANRRRTEVNETHADVLMEVWGYARSRETVARAALGEGK